MLCGQGEGGEESFGLHFETRKIWATFRNNNSDNIDRILGVVGGAGQGEGGEESFGL